MYCNQYSYFCPERFQDDYFELGCKIDSILRRHPDILSLEHLLTYIYRYHPQTGDQLVNYTRLYYMCPYIRDLMYSVEVLNRRVFAHLNSLAYEYVCLKFLEQNRNGINRLAY